MDTNEQWSRRNEEWSRRGMVSSNGGEWSRRNGIQSTFWFQVRLLEDVVLVPACWEALILGCDDKALGFCPEASCF